MLALIAGKGALPALIAAAQPTPPLVAMLMGNAPDGLTPDVEFRVETIGSLLEVLKQRGVKDICLCGAIERPNLDPAALDAQTVPLVPTLMQAAGQGDDAALRAIMQLFEQAGFSIKAAHDLVPSLVASEGILSTRAPDAQMHDDVAHGMAVLAALSPFDIGQACVVGQGQVIGIETIAGTDALIAGLPDVPQRKAAMLIKAPKSDQDLRADMPTIGPDTINAVAEMALAGVAIKAGGVLMIAPERCVELANEYGLVLWAHGEA